MYKLFLCFRYLRSKVFAILAVVAVALFVWMMLLTISVMSGFLNKIERAAKGLFGDVIVAPASIGGLAGYDEFIAEMEANLPEDVEAASPFILSGGFIRIEDNSEFSRFVQIAGIRLPDRARVTDFEDGLFVQGQWKNPTFAPSLDVLLEHLEDCRKKIGRLDPEPGEETEESDDPEQLRRRLASARSWHDEARSYLLSAQDLAETLEKLQRELAQSTQQGADEDHLDELREKILEIEDKSIQSPAHRVILGLGIPGLSFRTETGKTVRLFVPGNRIVLYIIPLGKPPAMLAKTDLNIRRFTIVDDSCTDVSSIDKNIVYVPFETLQELAKMGADPNLNRPARCSEIHIKVCGENLSEQRLREVAGKIQRLWNDFAKRNRNPWMMGGVSVDTWRQRQAHVVGPIEKQRTLMTIILGAMSLVSVVLIFVVLYTIVVQKTREIGVLKAVGASDLGVASLFLGYGAVIGGVGAAIGLLGGWWMVLRINEVQDWVDRAFGFRVWSRDQFMFEKIPNEVDWNAAWMILLGAILSGLLGALVPSIRAARMQPAEALRYE